METYKNKQYGKVDNYEFERKLYNEGHKYIAGTDEVGRGCIAGPVVACAIIMPKDIIIEGVTDSKKISEKNRKLLKAEIEKQAIDAYNYRLNELIEKGHFLMGEHG